MKEAVVSSVAFQELVVNALLQFHLELVKIRLSLLPKGKPLPCLPGLLPRMLTSDPAFIARIVAGQAMSKKSVSSRVKCPVSTLSVIRAITGMKDLTGVYVLLPTRLMRLVPKTLV